MDFARLVILGAALLLFSGPAWAVDRLSIYTVNYPLAYFAERIGGDLVDVAFPVPADVDPAYWMPDQKMIAAYQQADLILLNGANYAKWVGKVSLPRGKLVDTSRKFKGRYIHATEATTHSHGAEGAHAHEALAFTTWLDFSLARLQAESVCKALVRKRPTAEGFFKTNFQNLSKELQALDSQMRQAVSADPGRPLLGSHPVYDYLAAGYGLNLKSVHWEPGEVPSRARWLELQRVLKEHKVSTMLWEGEPVSQVVDKLSAMGIGSTVFDPCASRPGQGDFMTVMRQNVTGLAESFK